MTQRNAEGAATQHLVDELLSYTPPRHHRSRLHESWCAPITCVTVFVLHDKPVGKTAFPQQCMLQPIAVLLWFWLSVFVDGLVFEL